MSKIYLLPLCLLAACQGCSSERLVCDVERLPNGKADVSPLVFHNATIDLIARTEKAENQLRANPSLVGLNGWISRAIPFTVSADFATEIKALRGDVARQKARELALVNDGDTLLGTKHGWQCKTFADSIASLDVAQSSEQFLENLSDIKTHFLRVDHIFSTGKTNRLER